MSIITWDYLDSNLDTFVLGNWTPKVSFLMLSTFVNDYCCTVN